MKRKRHSAEQIISKLREAEVLLQKGQAFLQVCRQLGVTARTYYRWRKAGWHTGEGLRCHRDGAEESREPMGRLRQRPWAGACSRFGAGVCVLVALAAAAVLSKTLFTGPSVPLLLELAPYRRPKRSAVGSWGFMHFPLWAQALSELCCVATWCRCSVRRSP